jgi:hypothetical protein
MKFRVFRAAEFGAWIDTIRAFGARILREGWGPDFASGPALIWRSGGDLAFVALGPVLPAEGRARLPCSFARYAMRRPALR